jgi:carbon-monoxide dehydrogenase medium subunit
MYPFFFHRPNELKQVIELLSTHDDAKLPAGGHTLLPVLKQRLSNPSHLIDLANVKGLSGIALKAETLAIGAMTTHADIASSAIVHDAIPAVAELASQIGDPAVRHRGTIGGSIANNDPTADYPAAALALDVTIVTSKWRLKAAEFFVGLFTSALEPDEVVTRVEFRASDRPITSNLEIRPLVTRWSASSLQETK